MKKNMQINHYSSQAQAYTRGVSYPQSNARTHRSQIDAVDSLRRNNSRDLHAGKSNFDKQHEITVKRNLVDKDTTRAVVNSSVPSENKNIVTANNTYLPASYQASASQLSTSQYSASQYNGSTEHLINPVKDGIAAFSRHAVQAYETTRRLDENNQLIKVLGFDAFA